MSSKRSKIKVDLRDEKTVLLLKRVVREAVRPYLGYLVLPVCS